MDFRVEQRFPAPVEMVEATLLDPAFAARLGTAAEVLSEERDGSIVRRQVRHAFTGELSAAVTTVVDPDKLTWVDVGVHDLAAHRSTHHIVPDHYVSRLTCEYEAVLRADGNETARVVSGSLRVHMPFVGRRVERAIVSGLAEHAAREEEAFRTWTP